MGDAATLAVLKDLLYFSALSLLVGLLAYQWLERRVDAYLYTGGGNVFVTPYGWPDAIAALGLAAILTTGIWAGDDTPSEVNPTKEVVKSVADQAMSIGLGSVIMLMIGVVLLAFIRVVRDLDPAEMFGIRTVPVGRVIVIALCYALPSFLLVTALSNICNELLSGVWHDLQPQEPVKVMQESGSLLLQSLLGVSAVIIAPLTEELLFRGYLYGVLKRFTDSYFAAVASALIFALVHQHIGTVLPLFSLGLVLVLAYELTGSLLVPIFIHALFNLGSTALILMGVDA